ncbi:upstream-binding factor 1-like protein 1 isoform X2 [Halichoeres trimaculatus]|uniref:upstream-binding factor 1-like protein 1 isoform X2 n=1 Tax=Halichoeres trimaculatus TaxID=147232 RepID=UPI003D9DBED1
MTAGEKTWTKANTQKLLDSLRNNIPASTMSRAFFSGLKAIDWDEVAFEPFSPENCRNKWESMMLGLKKVRTLEELIQTAEDTIYSPKRKKVEDGRPQKPACNGYILFCNERSKSDDCESGRKSTYLEMWKDLTDEQRSAYSNRCLKLWNEYRLSEKQKRLRKRKSGVSRFRGEPEMPPRSAYAAFVKEQFKLGALKGAFFKEVRKKWLTLPESEIQAYRYTVQQDMTEYRNELREWFEELSPEVKEDFLQSNPLKKMYLESKKTPDHHRRKPSKKQNPAAKKTKEVPPRHSPLKKQNLAAEITQEDNPRHSPLDSGDEEIESSSSDELEFEELEGDGQGDVFEYF